MFYFERNSTLFGTVFTTAELVFHAVVRNIRSQHVNAVIAIAVNILQIVLLATVFYFILSFLGPRVAKIRGEFALYLLSGVFMFITHIKAVSAISGLGTGNNPMTLHSPMNMMVTLLAAAFGQLYTQLASLLVILFIYNVTIAPLEMQNPGGAFGMFVLAWFTGCAVGLVFLSVIAWFPTVGSMLKNVYRRMNMIFSGKMFVANSLGSFMLGMFMWNPLFHIIDQCRGFIFKNYFPRVTSWEYALWVGIVLIMIGLLAEFYTRQQFSQSWNARR